MYCLTLTFPTVYVTRMLPLFMSLLDHKDVEVRSAAGENIALLYESAQRSSITLPFDEEIVERFRVMSKDSSKKTSKKDRKTQRTVFRDIHATLAVRSAAHFEVFTSMTRQH